MSSAQDVLNQILALAKPFEGQIEKGLWEQLLHPYLQKQEAKIGQDYLKSLALMADVALDKAVEADAAKHGA